MLKRIAPFQEDRETYLRSWRDYWNHMYDSPESPTHIDTKWRSLGLKLTIFSSSPLHFPTIFRFPDFDSDWQSAHTSTKSYNPPLDLSHTNVKLFLYLSTWLWEKKYNTCKFVSV